MSCPKQKMSGANIIVMRNFVKMKGPIIIKKKIAISKKCDSNNMLKINSKLKPLFRDDVIYETCDSEFLEGKYRKLVLVNRLNILTNGCKTIAKYYSETMLIDEKSSDQVTTLIGQKNYDTVFSTLLSVIDQKQKIKAIIALLSVSEKVEVACQNVKVEVACQTEFSDKLVDRAIVLSDQSNQTDETCMEIFKKSKLKRQRMKRQKVPYVVKDSDSECITKTDTYAKWSMDIAKKSDEVKLELIEFEELPEKLHCDEFKPFPAIHEFHDENSMESKSNLSFTNFSITSEALDAAIKDVTMKSDFVNFDPNVKDKNIEKENNIIINQEDIFHIATPERLSNVSPEEKCKLIRTQQYIDGKYFLTRMENDNLVIHHAVMTDDVHLLKRHCLLLKKMQGTVDFTNASNLTPLQLSILLDCQAVCTKVLLNHGADPMFCDEDDRTILHLAAEGNPEKLKVIIEHCTSQARLILQENEGLCMRDEFQIKSDQQLALCLLRHMCQQCDSQGYTPLMVASRLGKYENVLLLVQAAPTTVNKQAASNGDTALYIAVVAACIDATNRSNKSKVSEHYSKTIEILLENGADPSKYNNSGSNVHSMLLDTCMPELSSLVANKIMSNYISGPQSVCPVSDPYMLLKDTDGNVQIQTLKQRKSKLPVGGKILSDSAENSTKIQKPDVITFPLGANDREPGGIEQTLVITEQRPLVINEQKPRVADTNTREFVENPATKTRIIKPKPIILENVKFTNGSRILPKINIMSNGTIKLQNASPTRSITDKPSNILLKKTDKLPNSIELNKKESKRKVPIDPLDISISTPSTSKIKKLK